MFIDEKTQVKIYADLDTRNKALLSYGLILWNAVNLLSNTTKVESNGIIFLGKLNVIYGIVDVGYMQWNSSKSSFPFDDMDKIYSNGGCEIYKRAQFRARE